MTRVKQHPHHMGGIACEPAPRTWVEAFGVWLIGLAAGAAPAWLWRWLQTRLPGLDDGPGEQAS